MDLIKTKGSQVFTGSEGYSWGKDVSRYGYLNYLRLSAIGMDDWKKVSAATYASAQRSAKGICNLLKPMVGQTWAAEYKTNNAISFTVSSDGYFGFNFGYEIQNVNTKLQELYENDTPLSFAYELETPVTYHLDSIEALYTLVGTNNVWADCGDISVTASGITPIT